MGGFVFIRRRHRLSRFATVWFLVAWCVAEQAGGTEPVSPEDAESVAWLAAMVNERGQHCDREAERTRGGRILIACGAAGLWEVEVEASKTPQFVRSHDLGGEVAGFFDDAEGHTWIEVHMLQARPLDSVLGPVAPPSQAAGAAGALPAVAPARRVPRPPINPKPRAEAAAPPAPRAPSHVGRVIRVELGEAVISLGADDGLKQGDRIEFTVERSEPLEGGEAAISRESVALGLVTSVSAHHAKVELGLNERVPVGAIATPIRGRMRSLSAPPRIGGLWEAEAMARPFLALSELGGGILFNASIGYRFERLFNVKVLLDPMALADVDGERGIVAGHGAVLGSLDSHFFEMGLGVGVQTVNSVSFGLDPGSGLAFSQLLRLGASDGLNLRARSSIVLFHREFEFGALVISSQIPLRRGYWFVLGGGGGNVGYAYGELGLRTLLSGNGDRGSAFLTATVGGAAVFEDGTCDDFNPSGSVSCDQDVSYGGPMAGVGAEWRF